MVEQPESRSSLGMGFDIAARITTVGVAFALPPAIGLGVDRWLGTTLVATLIGVLLGLVAGVLQTVRLAQQLSSGPVRRPLDRDDRPGKPT
jgi:F0F1-type ATP synthase assembly protein I